MPKLSNVKGLIKHPRSRHFWFRRSVPEDLRIPQKLGKWEIKFSLNTSDLRKAELLAAQHWVAWTHRFDDLRHGREPTGLVPTDRNLAELAVWWRDLWPKADEIEDSDGAVENESVGSDGKIVIVKRPLTPDERAEKRRLRLIETEKIIYDGDALRLASTAQDILKQHGFSTSRSIIERFVPVIADAEYDAYRIQSNRERNAGSLEILRRDPMEYVSNNISLSKLLEEYLVSKKPRTQTETEWRTAFKRLIEVTGDKPAKELSKHDIREFLRLLEKMPSRTKRVARELPIQEVVKLAERNKLQRISVETVRKHITAVRSVFAWGIDNDLVGSNPASKMAPKRSETGSDRMPFDQEDLAKIFDEDAYQKYAKGGADFWVPLIALYSGARLEEIAQLHCADIRFEMNIQVIDIIPNALTENDINSKRVKNRSSQRTVPLHQSLIKLGFLEFVDGQQDKGHKRLFPKLKRNVNARLGSRLGQRFSKHLRDIGISDQRKVFHSFRHTFKDACRNAGLREDVHDRLTGHSNSSVGRSYGQGHDLSVLNEEINKVQYPGLPLMV